MPIFNYFIGIIFTDFKTSFKIEQEPFYQKIAVADGFGLHIDARGDIEQLIGKIGSLMMTVDSCADDVSVMFFLDEYAGKFFVINENIIRPFDFASYLPHLSIACAAATAAARAIISGWIESLKTSIEQRMLLFFPSNHLLPRLPRPAV